MKDFPMTIYHQVLLFDGKVIDWKVGPHKKGGVKAWAVDRFFKEFGSCIKYWDRLEQKTNEVYVTNELEYNFAFTKTKWLSQFELHEKFHGFKPTGGVQHYDNMGN